MEDLRAGAGVRRAGGAALKTDSSELRNADGGWNLNADCGVGGPKKEVVVVGVEGGDSSVAKEGFLVNGVWPGGASAGRCGVAKIDWEGVEAKMEELGMGVCCGVGRVYWNWDLAAARKGVCCLRVGTGRDFCCLTVWRPGM